MKIEKGNNFINVDINKKDLSQEEGDFLLASIKDKTDIIYLLDKFPIELFDMIDFINKNKNKNTYKKTWILKNDEFGNHSENWQGINYIFEI